MAHVGSGGGTRRGACNLKPSNQRLNYNHALFCITSRTGGYRLARSEPLDSHVPAAREDRVAYSPQSIVQTLIYPMTYRPNVRTPKFPPWCSVKYTIIGPNPFAGSGVADRWDIPRPQGPTRKINRPSIPPLMIYKAAQLMDTSDKPSIAAGIMTTADDIKNNPAT